ncbi:phasin family protein [Rickettsia prowazekii]|uniref:Phasin domain-containing protein n=2 Tax=Rickettsia prowazekii TaxID=782 RepID=Q9ZCD9_RICPR|nr:phasin family protein [Rickettsia prowazekii]ADE30383.1 Phasin family protein [Rickettsia prowazekii str. Rp22]AFE49612.1 hypothetical protein M9W_03960 [Rickettsia prowazekii str. Chernikova]AFE50456.1 hypothetical protein M9Y_03965 [Rickettsia prowazekii str. Katsinyian]AFE51300.1 hypothetical protein MA1_03955 [Rickettsia prowazekii str. BuV67-CWPP]AFE52138.1 hypothetical protein MA3_04000 [Rickettsia prowazekii str. Dachau]
MLNNTQFLNLMKSYMKPEFYMSSIKNTTNLDLSSITNTIQKAMNIFFTTNKISTESMQSLFKKNSEIIQNNINTILNSTKEVINSKDFKQATEYHQKCVKSIYETSMDNAKELANIAYEASNKIFEAANKHITKNIHNASNNIHNTAEQVQKNFNNKSA